MGWRRYLRRAKTDRERREEIESYLRIETDDNLARGMPNDEARLAARRKLGNATIVREEIYRMNTIQLLDSLARATRNALRALRRNPGFTLVAVLTLALGIGANTTIFSVVNAVLIKPLPYPDPDALVGVWHSYVRQGVKDDNVAMSGPWYFGYREQNRTFEKFGVWSSGAASVTGGEIRNRCGLCG